MRRRMPALGRRAKPMLGSTRICRHAVSAIIEDAGCKHGVRMTARRCLFEQDQSTQRIADPAAARQHHLAERGLSVIRSCELRAVG
jgi:hypothetical protein